MGVATENGGRILVSMDGLNFMAKKHPPRLPAPPPPPYDESRVRRFEPGTVQAMTIATLRAIGSELSFTRGLKSVRVRDKHDNYKKYTWSELETFVDGLRVKAGLEPIFSIRKRSRAHAVATKVAFSRE